MRETKIALKLEFYLRGKRRIPAVSFTGVGGYGVPMTPSLSGRTPPDPELVRQNAIFDEFSAAAHKFCQALKAAGELG